MKCTISFKHLEHTESLDSRIHEKTEQFCKFFHEIMQAKWICYVKDQVQYAELVISGPKMRYHAKAGSENLYKSIDLVLSKMGKQLHKRKETWKNRLHSKHRENFKILDPEQAWLLNDGEYHFEKMKKAS